MNDSSTGSYEDMGLYPQSQKKTDLMSNTISNGSGTLGVWAHNSNGSHSKPSGMALEDVVTTDHTASGIHPYQTNDQLASDGFWNLSLNNTQKHETAASSPWKVINYQIPVPIGDCSAHFLVEKETNKVHRAFLMDGGTNAGTYVAWVQILKGLRFIDLELGNAWKFDSWVVTHWDADHYRGVKDLLLNGGIEFTRCRREENAVITGSPGSFGSLYFADDAWLCCGAWDTEAMFKGGDDLLRLFVKKDELLRWDMLTENARKGTRGQALLRCKWGEALIGLDLFTRSRQFIRETGEQYEFKYNPRKKSKEDFEYQLDSIKDAAAAANTPRFCVVGANGFGIGQADPFKKEKPTRNETSILALLYWKSQNLCSYYTGGDGNPGVFKGPVQTWFNKTWRNSDGAPLGVEMVKLDHHGSTGENLKGVQSTKEKGESNFEEEKQSSESDSESKSNEKEQECPPADLEDIRLVIEDVSPCKVLVTPGSKHGHPAWDVMVFLRDYFERSSDASGMQSAVTQGLFTTRVPYWIMKEEVTLKDLNLKYPLGSGVQERKPLAAGNGSDALVEEGKQAPTEANRADPKFSDEDDDGDSEFTSQYGIRQDAQHRREGQTEFQSAREAYVKHILAKDKAAPYLDRKGKIRYKFWTGKKANRRNSPALKKAVDKAIKDYREKYEKEAIDDIPEDETLEIEELPEHKTLEIEEEISTLRGAPKKKSTGAQRKAFKDISATSEDEVELDLLRELCKASNEMNETTDDAKLEGVEDFEAICWQPLTASEAEDPHFLIRFEFGGQRQDTVVRVYDDSGRFEYVKKPLQDSKDSGQPEDAQTDSQVPQGRDQDKQAEACHRGRDTRACRYQRRCWSRSHRLLPLCQRVEIVEQSDAFPTGTLAEDEQQPWTKYAHGECAIATMLSAKSIKAPVEPALGARAASFYGKRGPQNMVFQYYSKRRAATEGNINKLIDLAQMEKERNQRSCISSTAKAKRRPKKPTSKVDMAVEERKSDDEDDSRASAKQDAIELEDDNSREPEDEDAIQLPNQRTSQGAEPEPTVRKSERVLEMQNNPPKTKNTGQTTDKATPKRITKAEIVERNGGSIASERKKKEKLRGD